ncbi:T9SS type A sorting domain-containing protein [Tamlana agarivorans]|uniref:T9SS type A sorting domain-containing protein n=1 Tax=Pseudotamlana agarivorans TaxID=481183 RepID=A0ACC5U720_9FLAO|nr:T9SS type A sorting domain-containing protein [Tamlana agarivorans]MBU2950090.1 T9SS type A sorting domain-containing protein [Tamlana agarivorans]
MKKLCIALFVLVSMVNISAQNKNSSEKHVKRFFYKDSVVSIERFYRENKRIDSIKTYYKSGEPDECFYFKNGRYQGTAYKFNKFGETLTTWVFDDGHLLKRTDHKIELTTKNKEKVQKYHAKLIDDSNKIKTNPNDLKTRYSRAKIRRYFDNNTLALHDFNQIKHNLEKISKIKNVPEKIMGGMYDNLASIYQDYEMENYTIHYRLKAINASPKESRLYYNLGNYLVQIQSYRLGIPFLNKAVKMVPGHSFANWSLSVAYTDLGEYEKAMAFVNTAFKNEDNIHRLSMGTSYERDLHTTRGYLYHKLGETDKGITDLEEALKINKNNAFAYRNLGEIYYDLENYDLACEYLQKAETLGYEKTHDRHDIEELLEYACDQVLIQEQKSQIQAENKPATLAKFTVKPYAYPNPTRDVVNIKNLSFKNYNFLVFDYAGKMVKQGTKNTGINLSSLPNGVYIIKLMDQDKIETFRVIKE